MKAIAVLALPLALIVLLGSCGKQKRGAEESACLKGGALCAAADAPPGLRKVLKGHRMTKTTWMEKTNKESGVPDIGIKAEWEPIHERR